MTALERKLIGLGLGMLLTFAIGLAGYGAQTWQWWLVMVLAGIGWSRVPVEPSSSALPDVSTAAHTPSEHACSGAWDGDFGDCG